MRPDQVIDLKISIESHFQNDLWLDFEVQSYSSLGDGQLVIAASRDFSYYHNLEIRFSGVTYFSGSFSWKSSPSRSGIILSGFASNTEQLSIEESSIVCAVEFIDDENSHITVVADSAEINWDTVYYYQKSPLLQNERIATWVSLVEEGKA